MRYCGTLAPCPRCGEPNAVEMEIDPGAYCKEKAGYCKECGEQHFIPDEAAAIVAFWLANLDYSDD